MKKAKSTFSCLHQEGWIVGDGVTFGAKGELFIDAVEDSRVVPYPKDLSISSNPVKLHNRIAVLQKRIIMLMSASALERYEHFVKTYPEIIQRVPQKMIASYLGITPQALSTIRGTITKRKK